MSQDKTKYSRRFGVDFEEEKAWVGFYRNVGNPAIAVEVMNQLESDPPMKRTHLALYLRCKESLRVHKTTQARNKRIGNFVRMLFNAVFLVPVIAVQRWLRQGGDIAVECLPEVVKEPAAPEVHRLSKESEFAQAKAAFGEQVAAPAVQQPAVKQPEVQQPEVKQSDVQQPDVPPPVTSAA